MKYKKVLIVEDDRWFADAIAVVLKNNHFKTKISPHVVAAIDDIDDFAPDYIIMDLLLVGSTAFTLMNELQSHSDLAAIPIIICSNLAGQLHLEDLQAYGVRDLLDKTTMKPDDILSAIERLGDDSK